MARVLVAEDDALNRLVIGEMLTLIAPTLSVSFAHDGQQALEMLRSERFDLLLSDVSMPNLDGLGLLEAVHEQLATPIPVVCITAFAVVGEKEALLDQGFDDYLSKPVDMDELRRVVARYLGKTPTSPNASIIDTSISNHPRQNSTGTQITHGSST
jgi:CheY-like chemotaxis protein